MDPNEHSRRVVANYVAASFLDRLGAELMPDQTVGDAFTDEQLRTFFAEAIATTPGGRDLVAYLRSPQ